MQFNTIDTLNTDITTGLFDMTTTTFVVQDGVNFYSYIISETDTMRMDIVCYNIYRNVDHVDFLCKLNNIINPLNIQSGTLLIYVAETDIPDFSPTSVNTEQIQQKLTFANKTTRIDPSRANLPPTVNQSNNPPVQIQGNNIILGDQIFNV